MASETGHDPASPHDAAGEEHRPGHGRPARGGLRRLLASLTALIDLQYRIWLTQAKLAMMRVALYAVLFTGALVLGVLAVIFLCIGAFHVLTDVLQMPVWSAFLVFGAGLGVIALICILVATRMLTRTEAQDAKEGES